VNAADYAQLFIFIVALVLITPIAGSFMTRVFEGRKTFLSLPLGWLERLSYLAGGVDPKEEMSWRRYAKQLLLFNLVGIVFLFVLQLVQASLPLNPQNLPNVGWHSALNTAISFVTNTNWQGYSPEVTMSYLTQMLALAVQNFLSAATGIVVAIALVRGFALRSSPTIGNFWTDLTRTTIYVLLPFSVLLALIFVSQGVVQTFAPYVDTISLEGIKQSIALGPAASQVSIKMLGTNGGGFFNANSAHPFENPTPLTNFLEMFVIFAIPAGLTYVFGSMVKARRQGWAIFAAMFTMFIVGLGLSLASEFATNPILHQAATMEGKETRFGVFNSVLFSVVTTDASCGAVNAMHSSLSPLSGGVAMFNMAVNEVIFGGVGSGLYGMLLFALLTVFLAGLMVGRTPEYLGKKIEAWEMKMVILSILAPSAIILLGAGISVISPAALSSLANKGPHGLSEILYAFMSGASNNGSAFAGLNANTLWFNLGLSLAMLVGRFLILLPALAVAGSLAKKKYSPPSAGTFLTDTPLFVGLLIGVIVIEVALTFVPAMALGPIVEHFLMLKGITF
jgi:K+-transporting ATPase ATPase A chain